MQTMNYVLQYFARGSTMEGGFGSNKKPLLPSATEVSVLLIHNELSDADVLLKWSTSRHGSDRLTLLRQYHNVVAR